MRPSLRLSFLLSCGFTLLLASGIWLCDSLGHAAIEQALLKFLVPAWVITMMLPIDYGEPGRESPILGWAVLYAVNVLVYWAPLYILHFWVLAVRDEFSGKGTRPN